MQTKIRAFMLTKCWEKAGKMKCFSSVFLWTPWWEWETIVTKRIDNDLVEVKQLQKDRLHYENKVSGLRNKVNRLESKNKPVKPDMAEKLERNEQKLKVAWESHEIRSAQLCVMIEEATACGWKDLYPLVQTSMSWDVCRLNREKESYENISSTLDKISETATKYVNIAEEVAL